MDVFVPTNIKVLSVNTARSTIDISAPVLSSIDFFHCSLPWTSSFSNAAPFRFVIGLNIFPPAIKLESGN